MVNALIIFIIILLVIVIIQSSAINALFNRVNELEDSVIRLSIDVEKLQGWE